MAGGSPIHNSSKQGNFQRDQVFPVDLCVSYCSYSEYPGLSAIRKDDSSLLGGRGHLPGSLTACRCCPHRQGITFSVPAPPCPLGNGLCWWVRGDTSSTWSPCSFPPLPLLSCVTSCFLQWLLDLADRLCHPDAGTDRPPPRTLSWQMQGWLQA